MTANKNILNADDRFLKGFIEMIEDSIRKNGDSICHWFFEDGKGLTKDPQVYIALTRLFNKLGQTSYIKLKAYKIGPKSIATIIFQPSRLHPVLKLIANDNNQEVFKLITESSAERVRRERKYWVTWTPMGHVQLNDEYVLATPNFESENYRFFEYIYKKDSRLVGRNELKKELGEKLKKISTIIGQLHFTGEIKRLFFPVTKRGAVFFHNNITEKEFNGLGIDVAKLEKQIKALKKV